MSIRWVEILFVCCFVRQDEGTNSGDDGDDNNKRWYKASDGQIREYIYQCLTDHYVLLLNACIGRRRFRPSRSDIFRSSRTNPGLVMTTTTGKASASTTQGDGFSTRRTRTTTTAVGRSHGDNKKRQREMNRLGNDWSNERRSHGLCRRADDITTTTSVERQLRRHCQTFSRRRPQRRIENLPPRT